MLARITERASGELALGPDKQVWALIKAVSPEVLVLTADHSYSEQDLHDLLEFCGHVEVLPRQAAVTTSERPTKRAWCRARRPELCAWRMSSRRFPPRCRIRGW